MYFLRQAARNYNQVKKTMVKAASLTVFSSVDPLTLVSQPEKNSSTLISKEDQALDAMDHFNHTRQRRALILKELLTRKQQQQQDDSAVASLNIQFEQPAPATVFMFHQIYGDVHSEGLLTFLETAWSQWEGLGDEGQDPLGYHHTHPVDTTVPRPFVPPNIPLRRAGPTDQRPSQHVLGQVGYYCTDTCTPIFHKLQQELLQDAALVHAAVERARVVSSSDTVTVSYIIPTHPGHHAAQDCFGGYCYVNHAAALAQNLSAKNSTTNARVAVLDVDYHCGNGTASIFDASENVLVVSLHCDPNHDYPFHSGFADQTGSAPGNTTLHLPMPPGTTWEQDYRSNLERGLDAVVTFNPSTLIVSLGLDTYDEDPCAMRRAGFRLQGSDYVAMGQLIAEKLVDRATTTHVIFVQEGGYRLTKVPEAAANVVLSFCAACHTQK